MQMKLKSKKMKIFTKIGAVAITSIVSLLVIVSIVFAASLYTYFTSGASNKFTFAFQQVLTISINEPGVNSQSVPWGTDTKPVSIENENQNGAVDAVARAMIVPVVYNSDGEVVTANLGDVTVSPNGDIWQLGDLTIYMVENWEDYWIFKDGYFYYKEILPPGGQTENLIEGATLSGGDYDGQTFTIQVLADGLCADDIAEWNMAITNNSVSFN